MIRKDDAGDLFQLVAKTALLTAIALGLYRFWSPTRIRHSLWSTNRLDGERFE